MKKGIILPVLFVVLMGVCTFGVQKASALTLTNASASATTSRPSPSSPLNANYAAGVSTVTVFDNLSTFLSSDSARFFGPNNTGDTVTVATTSADKLSLFFKTNTTALHNRANVIATPISAMHTIVFTAQTSIPASGKIEIAYPTYSANDSNQASPSAVSWTFNNLSNTTDIQSTQGTNCSWAITGTSASSTPKATCTLTTGVPAGTPVWIWIGCTARSGSTTTCGTQRPLLINPTSITARGTADVKSINVTTMDSSSNALDTTTLKMGTIESVFVVAHVDPTFSFTIDGVNPGTDMHTTSTCATTFANITTSNTTPQGSDPTNVNFGTIANASDTWEAQKFTITSNTAAGYAITATSSGFLLNPATGQYIVNVQGNVTGNNTPVPAAKNSSNGGFGIHPCDAQAYASTHVLTQWYSGGVKTNPLYANPSATNYYTLVNWLGALGNENVVTAGRDVIYSLYWAAPSANTPPGDYWEILTYTASVTF